MLIQVCAEAKLDADLFYRVALEKVEDLTLEELDKLLRQRVNEQHLNKIVSELERRQAEGNLMSTTQFINIAHGLGVNEIKSPALQDNF